MVLALVIFKLVGIDKIIIFLGDDAARIERKRRELEQRRVRQEQRVALVAVDVFPELETEVFAQVTVPVDFGAARAEDAPVVGGKYHRAVLTRKFLEDLENGGIQKCLKLC